MDTEIGDATPTQIRLSREHLERRKKLFPAVKEPPRVLQLVPTTQRPTHDAMDVIIAAVANVAGLRATDILDGPPTSQIIDARRLAMALCVRRGAPIFVVSEYFEVPPAAVKDTLSVIDPIIRDHLISRRTPIELILPLIWKEWIPKAQQTIASVHAIRAAVCKIWGVTMAEIDSGRRTEKLIEPRHVAMALCCHLTTYSLPAIGRKFGGRDHTTILHAREKLRPIIDELKKTVAADASPLRWAKAAHAQLQVTPIYAYWAVRP